MIPPPARIVALWIVRHRAHLRQTLKALTCVWVTAILHVFTFAATPLPTPIRQIGVFYLGRIKGVKGFSSASLL